MSNPAHHTVSSGPARSTTDRVFGPSRSNAPLNPSNMVALSALRREESCIRIVAMKPSNVSATEDIGPPILRPEKQKARSEERASLAGRPVTS